MILKGTQEELTATLKGMYPDFPRLPPLRSQMLGYQLLALFGLAKEHNHAGSQILEIGTGHGISAWVMSQAAPLASIVSLTIDPLEAEIAKKLWKVNGTKNIEVLVKSGLAYLAERRGSTLDMVFIDADHNRIALDMPWFNRLKVGGLLLCHDYSPKESAHPSPIVYATLEAFALRLKRRPDVEVVDSTLTGMAGFVKRKGERWLDLNRAS